tara:strand:- start:4494 stop:4697 length:204 start_codon:yes stop_codon:yes gene_type:complete
MVFRTGDRVELLSNPYAYFGMDLPVGTLGTVTRGGDGVVSVRFDTGLDTKAWFVEDGHGTVTLKLKE